MATPELQQRFQTVVDQHKKILYKVCNSYCRSRDDRDDLAQEIIIQLWRSFGRFDERYRFSTWMYRIALNVAISFYRRENTRTRYVISDEEHLLEAIDVTKDQPEEVRLLYEFIEGLDPLNKALVLLYLDGNKSNPKCGCENVPSISMGISEPFFLSNMGAKALAKSDFTPVAVCCNFASIFSVPWKSIF
jgi:RNA polymerase sigma factor (sigma-70 family)